MSNTRKVLRLVDNAPTVKILSPPCGVRSEVVDKLSTDRYAVRQLRYLTKRQDLVGPCYTRGLRGILQAHEG